MKNEINLPLLPMPEVPSDLPAIQELLNRMQEQVGIASGAMPEFVGNRTAYGVAMAEAQALSKMQRVEKGIQNGLLDIMKFTMDPYMPNIRKQFRFPRSKKRRIRKKWAKNPLNWREVPIAFAMTMPKARPFPDVDRAFLQLATAHRELFSPQDIAKRFNL